MMLAFPPTVAEPSVYSYTGALLTMFALTSPAGQTFACDAAALVGLRSTPTRLVFTTTASVEIRFKVFQARRLSDFFVIKFGICQLDLKR